MQFGMMDPLALPHRCFALFRGIVGWRLLSSHVNAIRLFLRRRVYPYSIQEKVPSLPSYMDISPWDYRSIIEDEQVLSSDNCSI